MFDKDEKIILKNLFNLVKKYSSNSIRDTLSDVYLVIESEDGKLVFNELKELYEYLREKFKDDYGEFPSLADFGETTITDMVEIPTDMLDKTVLELKFAVGYRNCSIRLIKNI